MSWLDRWLDRAVEKHPWLDIVGRAITLAVVLLLGYVLLAL